MADLSTLKIDDRSRKAGKKASGWDGLLRV